MERTKTQVVFLNSSNATTYNNADEDYKSDVSFYLSRAVQRPKDTILALRLDTFCFPVSFYVVNDTNNTLVTSDDAFLLDTTYTIPVGNYTADELEAELNTLMGGDDYTITYDAGTMKYTFENSVDEFVIRSTSTCLNLIGFTSGDHTSTTQELTSDSIVSFIRTKVLYVDVQNLSINNLNATTGQRTTALTCVPVSSSYGDFVFYENTRASYVYLQEDTINNLRIRLYEEDLSTLVDFQGKDWTMSVEFSFVPV